MPKRVYWSDDEWVFLLDVMEDPEVSKLLAATEAEPSTTRKRGRPSKDKQRVAAAARYIIDQWDSQFNHPWKAETHAAYVERMMRLRKELPEESLKGMEFVHQVEDETPEAFNQRVETLADVSVELDDNCGLLTLTGLSAGGQIHRTQGG